MVYSLEISKAADEKFGKMAKKDRKRLVIVGKKIAQILQNPYHFKPLSNEMHGIRRVHVDTSFVLTYEIDEARKTVCVLDFEHHDKAYCR